MVKIHETHLRSIVKGIVWRILASLATVLLVYAFTGKLILAAEVGAVEIVVKLLLYYSHERVWDVISWGRIRTVNEE